MARTPVDLFAFGSRTKGPRAPRPGIDIFPDEVGMVGPEIALTANGASTFGDISKCLLAGHYFRLPAGTELSEGLDIIADGEDVRIDSLHPVTHHTVFPSTSMPLQRFVELFQQLPWQYAGKKA